MRARLRSLRDETWAVALALRHPGTPWYARAVAAATVAYLLSPIDLIPDFVPVLGQLDDLLIVPLGVWLTWRLVPAAVMAECRERARAGVEVSGRGRWVAAGVVVVVWVAVVGAVGVAVWRLATR